jgi:hypothetical protein
MKMRQAALSSTDAGHFTPANDGKPDVSDLAGGIAQDDDLMGAGICGCRFPRYLAVESRKKQILSSVTEVHDTRIATELDDEAED